MRSRVAILHIDSFDGATVADAIHEMLDMLGGLKRIVPRSAHRVLIKPNIVFGESWDTGITTHPGVIEALINELRSAGVKVIIGEGPGYGSRGDDVLDAVGIRDRARHWGVPFYNLKSGEWVRISIPNGKRVHHLTVHKIVPQCDFIISAAKLKTHCEAIVSLSLKNMKGLIHADAERMRFHTVGLNECLVDLNRMFRPHLSVVEGLIALEGIGPGRPGKPVKLGVLVAGTDPVAVDAVCTRIMLLEPTIVAHIKLAADAGLGLIDTERIEIVGERIEDVLPESFEKPPMSIEGISPYECIQVVDGKPCSNCIVALASFLHAFLKRDAIENATAEVRILVGAKAQPMWTGNELAIGNCLRRYRGELPWCPGCPPSTMALAEIVIPALRGELK